jgi:hypothetical protein
LSTSDLEALTVSALLAADLPELGTFAIEALAAQVDLEHDQLHFGSPTLLVALTGVDCSHGEADSDELTVAFVAVVPGTDQTARRQDALDALRAIRRWMNEAETPFVPKAIRTERLHPLTVAALFATCVGDAL